MRVQYNEGPHRSNRLSTLSEGISEISICLGYSLIQNTYKVLQS